MNLRPAFLALALLVAAGSADARVRNVTDADAPRALPAQGPVSVRWQDPATFSEVRYSGNRTEAARGNWVEELAVYLRDRAASRLPEGQRLDVDILDIRRAGAYEPWRSPDLQFTRIIRDLYPPRMTLNVTLTGADGQVIVQGERTLRDSAFLMGDSPNDSDPLRFEKRMIDRWLRQELAAPGA